MVLFSFCYWCRWVLCLSGVWFFLLLLLNNRQCILVVIFLELSSLIRYIVHSCMHAWVAEPDNATFNRNGRRYSKNTNNDSSSSNPTETEWANTMKVEKSLCTNKLWVAMLPFEHNQFPLNAVLEIYFTSNYINLFRYRFKADQLKLNLESKTSLRTIILILLFSFFSQIFFASTYVIDLCKSSQCKWCLD